MTNLRTSHAAFFSRILNKVVDGLPQHNEHALAYMQDRESCDDLVIDPRLHNGVMSVVAEGRALGDPQRFAIFEMLRSTDRPLRVSELTQEFSLHHNAIRHHLGVLQAAGLIERTKTTAIGRGRPALEYRLSASAADRWAGSGPQEELSLMLLDLVESGDSAIAVGGRAGARLAKVDETRAIAPGHTEAESIDRIFHVTQSLGFDPSTPAAGVVALGRCPFAATASRSRDIICTLHRGLIEGVAAAMGGQVVVDDLVLADPHAGKCRGILRSAANGQVARQAPAASR